MTWRLPFAWCALALLLGTAPALACPACIGPSGSQQSLAQTVAAFPSVVIARPRPEPRRFEVVATIRGKAAQGDIVQVNAGDLGLVALEAGRSVVLARHPLFSKWIPLAPADAHHAAWLRRLAEASPDPATPEAWAARLNLFVPDLWSSDDLVAETAALEVARAPYTAIRTLAPAIDAPRLLDAAEHPQNRRHLPLIALLAGLSADPAAAAYVETRLAALSAGGAGDDLAALLVAKLERKGEPALPAVVAGYVRAGSGTPKDAEAALLAIGQQGLADARVPRKAVIPVYREVLRTNPRWAGAIARDMQAWPDWSLAAELAEAAARHDDPGTRLLVRAYLAAAPAAEA